MTNIDQVAAIDDPAERARVATELLAEHQSAVARLAQIRRKAVAELRSQGLSYAKVAQALGVTRARIAQLGAGGSTEEAFFGGRQIVISTPLRKQPGGRAMIAQEDVDAATRLSNYLAAVDIDTTSNRIPTTGKLDLKPATLVAICGPKSSPTIAELLERDPALDFSEGPDGRWRIIQRAAGHEFASGIDEAPALPEDIAYVGRLLRSDGRPMLVIAGVHAVGSLGAVDYLTTGTNLADLQRVVRSDPFSMVIASRFDPDTLNIEESTVLLAPQRHPNP